MKKKKGSVSIVPPPAVVVPLRKAVYKNLVGLVGNDAAENAFLAQCTANGINTLFCYGLTTILASTYAPFVTFYDKAKAAGITKIFAQRASEDKHLGNGFSSTKSYNLANPTKRLHFGLENEFWNYNLTGEDSNALVTNLGPANPGNVGDKNFPDAKGNIIYSQWIVLQTKIFNYAKSVGLDSDVYIGHFHDYVENTPAVTIVNAMIAVADMIEISWYVDTAEFLSSDHGLNFLVTRLNLIGAAGIARSKKVNLVIIYAGNAPYMETWFATVGNTLLKALNISITVINSNPGSVLTNVAGYNIAGFQGYAVL